MLGFIVPPQQQQKQQKRPEQRYQRHQHNLQCFHGVLIPRSTALLGCACSLQLPVDQDASVVVEVFSCIVELDHGAMGLYPPLGLASYVAYSSPFNGSSGFFVFQPYFMPLFSCSLRAFGCHLCCFFSCFGCLAFDTHSSIPQLSFFLSFF